MLFLIFLCYIYYVSICNDKEARRVYGLQNGDAALSAQGCEMATAIEKKANEMAREGWELVTFSVTLSAKTILVFRRNANDAAK